MNYYYADCFQTTKGRYLSLDEHRDSVRYFMASSEDEVYALLAEFDMEDSELTVQERWNVYRGSQDQYESAPLNRKFKIG